MRFYRFMKFAEQRSKNTREDGYVKFDVLPFEWNNFHETIAAILHSVFNGRMLEVNRYHIELTPYSKKD